MYRSSDVKKRDRIGVYLCVLPLIARFVLSYLFSHVSTCVQNDTVSYLLSSVLGALEWVLPFGIYSMLFVRQKVIESHRVKTYNPWIIFFCAYFVAGIMTIAYNVILSKFGYSFPSDDINGFGIGKIAIFVLTSVVLVPFAEEYSFRKVILFSLLPVGKVNAIFISAFMFAICHNVASYIYSFVMGIALAIICLKRSFGYSVLIHAVNNAISCAFAIMQNNMSENIYRTISFARFAVVCVVGVLCTALVIKGRYSCAKKS